VGSRYQDCLSDGGTPPAGLPDDVQVSTFPHVGSTTRPVQYTHTEALGVTPRSGTWHRCEVRAWQHRELKAATERLQRQIDSLNNTVAFGAFLLLCLLVVVGVLG
jgi:hypothetical protein